MMWCFGVVLSALCCLSLPWGSVGLNYTNPVISAGSTPDPGVLYWNETYYVAFTGTSKHGDHFALFESTDLASYTPSGHVFPSGAHGAPAWAFENFWAPEIHAVPTPSGVQFNVYFAARCTATKQLSIGVATAKQPTGPFTDIGHPLVGGTDMGYIDPTFHFESSSAKRYLIWKSDGNAIGKPTPIHIATLDDTGTSVVGTWTTLITNTLPWEAVLVEAPWLVVRDSTYYLFYSGNIGADYAVGVARSDSLLGPYTKHGPPILHNASGAPFTLPFWAPGHCSVLKLPDSSYAIWYHTYLGKDVPIFSSPRHLMLDTVNWVPGSSDEAGEWPTVDHGADVPSSTSRRVP